MSSPATTAVLADAEKGTSLWADAWTRLKKNKLAVFGLCVMSFLIVIAILTPWICLLYTSPSPRDRTRSRMPSSA